MPELDLSYISPNAVELLAQLQRQSGLRLADCQQCGACTAACPLSPYMDLTPRQLVRYVQLGQPEMALGAKTPWICAACHACSCRCPQQVNLPVLMEFLRREAVGKGHIAVPEVDLFTRLFMQTVRAFGRSHEILLSACYNVFSLHFWQDLRYAPGLYFRGKIHILPRRVKDRAALPRLLAPYDIKPRFRPFAQAKGIILHWLTQEKKWGEGA